MSRIFFKQPKSQEVELGDKVVVTADALTTTNRRLTWEFQNAQGGPYVEVSKSRVSGKGQSYAFFASDKTLGSYRCLCGGVASKTAVITLKGEPALEKPTKENDVFLEILEDTGEDASPDTIAVVQKAIVKKMPESLKE